MARISRIWVGAPAGTPPAGSTYELTAPSATITVTGSSVALTADRTISAASGTVTITGATVALSAGYNIAAATGTVTITGSTVSLSAGYVVPITSGSVTVTSSDVTLTYTAGSALNNIRISAMHFKRPWEPTAMGE